MSEKIIMKCGCIANATMNKKPYCFTHDCDQVEKIFPDLSNRIAKCYMCNNHEKSSESLAFFRYLPNNDFDSYYCGCGGWE